MLTCCIVILFSFLIKLGWARNNPDQNFLCSILGVFPIPQHPQKKPLDVSLESPDELIKCSDHRRSHSGPCFQDSQTMIRFPLPSYVHYDISPFQTSARN